MKVVSRKVNGAKSVTANLIYSIVKIITQFVFRSLFVHYLSVEYLGLNSAIVNVLNLLSITELGFTSVIVISLYRPIAEDDKNKIASIIAFYRKIFAIIGIAVFVLGMALLPFIDKLISVNGQLNVNLKLVYFIYLCSSSISYFFSYRSVLLVAFQELYKQSFLNTIVALFSFVAQILVVALTKNYYAYLFCVVFFNVLNYILNYILTVKAYPDIRIKNVSPIDKETMLSIKSNLKGMIYHKFSYVVLQASDSLIISSFIGTLILGVYTNYTLFTSNLILFFSVVSTALAGGIGSLLAENNREKSYKIYQDLKFAFFWLAGFCSICLFVLLNPALNLWANLASWDKSVNWTFDIFTVSIIVLNFYIYSSRVITGTFRESVGNFNKDRFKGVVEAIINLIVSILLVKPLGIAGVLIGTIVSCLCTSLWVDPYMIYKYGFNKPLRSHFKDIAIYTFVTICAGGCTWLVCSFIDDVGVWSFILKLLVCIVIPNIIYLISYFKTQSFKDIIGYIKAFLNKFNKKKGAQATECLNAELKEGDTCDENKISSGDALDDKKVNLKDDEQE